MTTVTGSIRNDEGLLGGARSDSSERPTTVCKDVREGKPLNQALEDAAERSASKMKINDTLKDLFNRITGDGHYKTLPEDKKNFAIRCKGHTMVLETTKGRQISQIAGFALGCIPSSIGAVIKPACPPLAVLFNAIAVVLAFIGRATVFAAEKLLGLIALGILVVALAIAEVAMVGAEVALFAAGATGLALGYAGSMVFGPIIAEINRGRDKKDQYRQPLSIARDFVLGKPGKLGRSPLVKAMAGVGTGMIAALAVFVKGSQSLATAGQVASTNSDDESDDEVVSVEPSRGPVLGGQDDSFASSSSSHEPALGHVASIAAAINTGRTSVEIRDNLAAISGDDVE